MDRARYYRVFGQCARPTELRDNRLEFQVIAARLTRRIPITAAFGLLPSLPVRFPRHLGWSLFIYQIRVVGHW